MSLILSIALIGQFDTSRLTPGEVAELAASYHRAAWEAAGRPTASEAAAYFNAQQEAERSRRVAPTPIPWDTMEEWAWIGWLGRRYGFGRQP